MKLWRVIRTDTVGWDEYEGFVCAAPNVETALRMDPASAYDKAPQELRESRPSLMDYWPRDRVVIARCIGESDEYTSPALILASFNAG